MGEFYFVADHQACVGAGMGTQHSCDSRELRAERTQPTPGDGARRTGPHPPELVQYAEPLTT